MVQKNIQVICRIINNKRNIDIWAEELEAILSSISGLWETGREQKWSSGTEFSGYSDFPEF